MKILLLGASGSIGTQTLDVIKKDPNRFSLTAFSVGKRTRRISYIIKAHPEVKDICIQDPKKAKEYKKRYPNINFFSGDEGLLEIIRKSDSEMVVNALVGFVGLLPSIETLKENKILSLANKESLVVGGELINDMLAKGYGKLYPIDSEHVAIAKCLDVDNEHVKNIILTASGGSFRKLTRDELKHVTVEDALNHPTWSMGQKITIDSATMVNKCFEIIEAHYLFKYPYDQIKVLLHDESHVHSLVQYEDGLLRADVSKPDMRNPIAYAIYQKDIPFKTYASFDLMKFGNYHYHKFNLERYPIVHWAKTVIEEKGTYGAVLNAANEEAVYAFLAKKIDFLTIEKIVETLMCQHKNIKHPTLEQILEVNNNTRQEVRELISKWRIN